MELEILQSNIVSMLQEIGVDINKELSELSQLQYIKERINNRVFTYEDYIKGFIYSLFSSQRKWFEDVYPYLSEIDRILNNYNPDFIRQMNIDKIRREIENTGANIYWPDNKGANRLHYVIDNLKALKLLHDCIEEKYGNLSNLDNQVRDLLSLVKLIVTNGTEYRLHGYQYPLAWEFLKNIGIPGIKFDTHVERILRERLQIITEASDREAQLKIFNYFANTPDIQTSQNYDWRERIVIFDNIVWLFGEKGFCSSDNPRCPDCVFKNICNYVKEDDGIKDLNNRNQSAQNSENVAIINNYINNPDVIVTAISDDVIRCICNDIQPNANTPQWESKFKNSNQYKKFIGSKLLIIHGTQRVSAEVSDRGNFFNNTEGSTSFRLFIRDNLIRANNVQRNQVVTYDLIREETDDLIFRISNVEFN